MEENKGLLLKCAMSYGLAMGIYWVIKYLFLIFGYSIPSLIFIYEGLSLAVPFIAYYLTKRYRQDIGGSISFFHAWRFGIMLYLAVRNHAVLLCCLDRFDRAFHILSVYRSARLPEQYDYTSYSSAEERRLQQRSDRDHQPDQLHSHPHGYSTDFQ
ncbi:putative uncharacterized protein [Parabacteroides johnsonii CAG:246]|nr:putative uncharacterized protein [Parabacteroides johnsonii CAG:246]